MINYRKVAIIGCGFVGSTSAFSIMQSGLFSEMVLIDADRNRAEGEALDISHGLPYSKPMKIYAGDYKDISDAYIIIITAGANQKPGETRLDLLKRNVAIFKSIIPKIVEVNKEAILLVVANPVDVLTYVTLKISGYPENRVFGSGTVLDTARLKYLLSQHLSVDIRNVHSFIIGEHGDSEIVTWSFTNISGVPLSKYCEFRGYFNHKESMDKIANEVRTTAYEIIEKKKATYYGIAMSVRRICESIVRDERTILPVSSIQNENYGLGDVVLSMPRIVGSDGLHTFAPIELNDEELAGIKKSAKLLKETIKELDI